jgi:hypothetical protein
LRESIANRRGPKQSLAPLKGNGRATAARVKPKVKVAATLGAGAKSHTQTAGSPTFADYGAKAIQARRQIPAKGGIPEFEIVEWWKPGWKERFM